MLKSLTLGLAAAAAGVYACLHDRDEASSRLARRQARMRSRHLKRDVVEFPPVLTPTESILVNSFDNNTLADWSYYYSSGIRLAGTNRSQAEWTADTFRGYGLESRIDEYWIWFTEPSESSLVLNRQDGSTHKAQLLEDPIEGDETTSYAEEKVAYHALTGSGDFSAEYVYVGRGLRPDFARLVELGVDLEGKIALAQYGGANRGVKVKNAQEHGMAGAILYTDPLEDGDVTELNGYLPYPEGPARHPSAIQRGSVRWSSLSFGDPSTVGYPSKKDAPRGDVTLYGPTIPSIPISLRDGHALLTALDGHGFAGEDVNTTNYIGAHPELEYSTGPAPGVTLDLKHLMEHRLEPAWDVIASINGTNPDEYVIIGNHRDGWTAGGAADAVSGGSILIEMAKAFNQLIKNGWKPKRTIIFGSWDAEEFGLMGSTEWVEDHMPELISKTVAYINLDTAVSGPRTSVVGSGEIHTIAIETMKKVIFPEGYGVGPTLYDMWYDSTGGDIGPLGSGSDYAAFYHNGIGSLDLSGGPNTKTDPVYAYHSLYDSYTWMSEWADPGFKVHTAMGQWATLLMYHIADDPLIPWDMPNAAASLRTIFDDLTDELDAAFSDHGLDLSPLDDAISVFAERSDRISELAQHAVDFDDQVLLQAVNSKYRDFNRGFASQGVLPGRSSYSNVVSAPGLDNGYGAAVFPAIQDSLDQKNSEQAQEWVTKSAEAVLRAAEILWIR